MQALALPVLQPYRQRIEFSTWILGQGLSPGVRFIAFSRLTWAGHLDTKRSFKNSFDVQSMWRPDIGMTCGESSWLHSCEWSVSSTSAVQSYFHGSFWIATLQWTWCSTAICPNGTSRGALKNLESLYVQLPQSAHRILCLVAFDVTW